jgi:hypothetical protein
MDRKQLVRSVKHLNSGKIEKIKQGSQEGN